ncbi:MAG: biotin carboxylase [Acidimicrobiia bacterium]|nr:biotin carboxylase [Acidimicrobiia bacterium]
MLDANDPTEPQRVTAPMQATVSAVPVGAGDHVASGAVLVVLESMKMEHEVTAPVAGSVLEVPVTVGAAVERGEVIVVLRPVDASQPTLAQHAGSSSDAAGVGGSATGADRDDLADLVRRRALGSDAARPEAVAKRHGRGLRTARENIEDLCDQGSFVEYGSLAIAAQRRRRDVEDLMRSTPADGLVGGIGRIDGRPTVVVSYDYMVLAGTQGYVNHHKKDRLFEIAERDRLPVVLFAEGGGGRPGDVDAPVVSGLDVMAFHLFARLSGQVPLVAVVAGRCFAGNAALAGCCDVIIGVEGANLGMGGPAMIEGGGLGVVAPDEIGPLSTQVGNGVVDVAVDDEASAVEVVRRYLSIVDSTSTPGRHADQEALRQLVPERRTRTYDVRSVMSTLFDSDSVLELRGGWGSPMITAVARLGGHAVGVLANDPVHLGGAIDTDAATKAADFLSRCDAGGQPVISLCDTPGFMVGPDEEQRGLVRAAGRLFTVGAHLRVPIYMVVLRKAYGLGAQAMGGGSLKVPRCCVAWPTGELGGMGLEGAVRLGFRKELEEAAPERREELFDTMVAAAYAHGKATNVASHFEIDDVIDPADTRRWLVTLLDAHTARPR